MIDRWTDIYTCKHLKTKTALPGPPAGLRGGSPGWGGDRRRGEGTKGRKGKGGRRGKDRKEKGKEIALTPLKPKYRHWG